MSTINTIKVWDPLLRVFHWSLVTAFLVTFVTEDNLMQLHLFAGYLVLGLLLFRLIWGLIGPKYARFSDFVRPTPAIISYLKKLMTMRAERYLGHNPAGGAMIIALLASLLLTTLTGLATYHLGFGEDLFEEVHEFFANFTLLLVGIHVGGVIVSSLYHNENLVRSMFTGTKQLEEME